MLVLYSIAHLLIVSSGKDSEIKDSKLDTGPAACPYAIVTGKGNLRDGSGKSSVSWRIWVRNEIYEIEFERFLVPTSARYQLFI
jgi:hypothetical protein